MNVEVLVEVVVVFSGVRHEDGSCGFGGMKVLSKTSYRKLTMSANFRF